MQHYTRVAIAVGNARRTAIPDKRPAGKVPHRTHGFAPGITAPDVVVPVHVETLVSAIADKGLPLAAEVPLHMGDRCAWVVHRELAAQAINDIEGGGKI